MPLLEACRVFLADRAIYPLDNEEEKRTFLDLVVKLDLLTLLDDPSGRLEGFLVSYRSWSGACLDRKRPEEQTGDSVTVDNIWLRPDLRGSGEALRRLIRHALWKNRERNAGAERIFIHMRHAGARPLRGDEIQRGEDVFRGFDYPAFYRKFLDE